MIIVPAAEHLPQIEIPFHCAEVSIRYNYSIPPPQREIITHSGDAEKIFRPYFEDIIETKECFYAIFLNQASQVTTISKISEGGICATIVDIRLVLCIALQTQAAHIIVAHNHPSGKTKPSPADQELTNKLKSAASVMDINILDHLILTQYGFLSMAETGYM